MNYKKKRRYVIGKLRWLIDNPTTNPSAGLTGYREGLGLDDLFSVFVRFESPVDHIGPWMNAKVYALAEDFESRLPSIGGRLILTAGENPVAIVNVVAECIEKI